MYLDSLLTTTLKFQFIAEMVPHEDCRNHQNESDRLSNEYLH